MTKPATLTVERTERRRAFRVSTADNPSGYINAIKWRVNLAGIKGSVATHSFRLWVEKHSALGKRLHSNLIERHRLMAELPAGDAYEWIWF